MDVACGEGIYSRIFKNSGAFKVVGVDVSDEMIKIAKKIEYSEQLGIEYVRSDIANFSINTEFDIATAIYLLHYLPTKNMIKDTVLKIYNSLKRGSKFVALSLNQNLNFTPNYYDKYGFNPVNTSTPQGGEPLLFKLHKIEKPFTSYCWPKATLEKIMLEAGFSKVEWADPFVAQEGLNLLGNEYWQNLLDAPWCIYSVAYKK